MRYVIHFATFSKGVHNLGMEDPNAFPHTPRERHLTRGATPPASLMAFWLEGLSKANWLRATAATRAMSVEGGFPASAIKGLTPPAILICISRDTASTGRQGQYE